MLKVRKKKGWGMKKEISVGKIGRMYEFGRVHEVNEKEMQKYGTCQQESKTILVSWEKEDTTRIWS